MSFGFGQLPGLPAGISAEDIARLFGGAPIGAGQGFSGSATGPIPATEQLQAPDTVVPHAGMPMPPPRPAGFGFGPVPTAPQPEAAPALPQSAAITNPPLPPQRPSGFGFGPIAGATPEADMPAVGAVPTSGMMPSASVAKAPEGPGFMEKWKTLADTGIGDQLLALSSGLLSARGGEGWARGFQNMQRAGASTAAADLARTEMALKQQKLARDAQGQNATKNYLLSKGMDASLAEAAMSNPTVLSSTLSQLNKDPSVVQVGGNKYSLKPGEKPTEANLLGPAEAERDKATLVDVPQADGSTIKTWVKPGETAGVTLGAPERAGNSNVAVVTEERRKVATDLGWKPDSDQFKSFVATGKLPKEDQQSLTVTDKNAILEADEKIAGAKSTIGQLRNALELSKKAYSGPLASTRGYLGSMIGAEGGIATQALDNQVTSQALENLKATFGGAPTEGERAILLQVQGASSQAPEVRDEIYRRAIAAAERRQTFNEQRAKELRGGTYYKTPQATVSADGAPVAPATAPNAPSGAPARPQSRSDYDALPSGAQYIAPDGSVRKKP